MNERNTDLEAADTGDNYCMRRKTEGNRDGPQ